MNTSENLTKLMSLMLKENIELVKAWKSNVCYTPSNFKNLLDELVELRDDRYKESDAFIKNQVMSDAYYSVMWWLMVLWLVITSYVGFYALSIWILSLV